MKSITRAWVAVGMLVGAAGLLPAQEAEISVEAAIATDVVDRMPVDTGSTFSADVGQLWCWTRVSGAEGTVIQHVWMHGPHENAIELPTIGGSPWRTWSNKSIPPDWTGEWRVEIRDEDGNVVETVRFTVG
ncbi:MAG: DUF2914 domain-containing protein [Acidimicrobiia bacterium]